MRYMPKYAAQTDGNHYEIVAGLRKAGRSVIDLSKVGKGCPDILISDGSDMWLAEIKVKDGQLSKTQRDFHEAWRGKPILIVHNVEEALNLTSPSRRERMATSIANKILDLVKDERG